MVPAKTPTWLPIAALLLVQAIFGFNYAATKVILAHYPPIFWGGFRMLIAAILMFTASIWLVPKEKRVLDRSFLTKCFLYGLAGITCSQAFFMIGLKYTTNTNAAILNTMTPIFTLFFAILIGAERFTPKRGIGFLLAVMGALVLRRFEDFQMTSDTFIGDGFTILNCISLALFFILSRDFLKKNSPFWVTAWMFLFGAITLLAIGYRDFNSLAPTEMTGTLGFAIFYNVILATMVTYFLNSWTLTKVKPSQVAIFIYLQPVIAVLNAWITLGEVPNSRVFLAMAFIFGGVAVGVIGGAKKE